jgi:mannose/fructose-specific phosphotransferase system component IIA
MMGINSRWMAKETATFTLTDTIGCTPCLFSRSLALSLAHHVLSGVKLSTPSATWDQRKDISFNVGGGSTGT